MSNNNNLKKRFMKLKDRIPPDVKKEVVYRFKTSDSMLSKHLNGKAAYNEHSEALYDSCMEHFKNYLQDNLEFMGLKVCD